MKARRFGADIVSGSVLILFSGLYFSGTRGLPPEAAFFPRLLAGALFVLALSIVIRGAREGRGALDASASRSVAAVVLTLGYAAAFDRVGFVATTLAYSTALAVLMGQRGWRLGAIAFGTTASTYALFGVALGVPLP